MFSPFIFGEHIVTGVVYLDMLKEFLMTVLEEEGPNNILYQQYFMLPNFTVLFGTVHHCFFFRGCIKDAAYISPLSAILLGKYKLLYVQLILCMHTNVSAEHEYIYMCWATRSYVIEHL